MSGAGLWLALALSAAAQDGKPDLEAADDAAAESRWSDAEALYRAELERLPGSPEAALGLARALEGLDSPESAIAYYLFPSLDNVPEAVAARARLLESLGRYDEAITAYSRLMVLQPPTLGALLGLARSFERAGRWAEAADGYRDVLAEAPDRLDARLALGQALEQAGQPVAAIQAYQPLLRTEGDSQYPISERRQLAAAAAEKLGPLLESVDEDEAAVDVYLLLPALRPEADPLPWYRAAARLLCAIDPSRAQELYMYLGATAEDAEVILCVADALHELGDGEGANRGYRKAIIIDTLDDVQVPADSIARARQRVNAFQIEAEAGRLSLVADEDLQPALRERVRQAQDAAQAGRKSEALDGLRAVVAEARHSSEAWAALGDMLAGFGDIGEAEQAYRVAVEIAPDDYRWHTRLALLLARAYSGTRHPEAISEISRAIRSGPHPPALRHERAVMHIGNRDFEAAAADLEVYLEAAPDGDRAQEARRLLANLRREPPEPVSPELAEQRIQDVPPEAERYFRRARVHLRNGLDNEQAQSALRELDLALEIAPDWPMALELYGDLTWALGRQDEALAAWEKALDTAHAPPGLLLKLAMVYGLLEQPGRAEALLIQAAQAGSVEAYYELAQLSFDRGQIGAAQDWLARFFDSATGGPDYQTALALKAQLDDIQLQRRVAASVVGAGGVMLAGVLWWRRQRQRTLQDLIDAAPESAHDLARLLSAIRHEVLKHNTTLLEEMALAGRNKDHSALRWAAERLFGEDGGAVRRYVEYRDAIERIGRKHGVYLDLKRRDPVFAPLSRAMRRLARMEGALRDPERAGDLEAPLQALHQALNIDAYQALGRLIQQMGTLTIDEALLCKVDRRVRAEPGLAEASLPALVVEGAQDGVPARVFPGDFEDIVANLLRNAYLASIEQLSPEARAVALLVEEDDDPITGFALVALRFCDQVPGALTSDMIQKRSIGRGLGLTVDLIARHNGSIEVEDEPGWRKAVVVRLPRAEGDALEEETP